MIIRKPFAFLVQRFKLLHFIILMPCMYIAYMFWRLMGFFNNFVSNGYVTNMADVTSTYYSFFMIIALILIIIFLVLVAILFKRKNKFAFPYLLLAIFYATLFAYTMFLPGMLKGAELAELESSTSLIIRGITNILFYGNPISIVVLLLLTFGFDFRTAEFLDIKEEINLDEEDSEEVEINIKGEDYKVKRFFRRYIREIKYYIIENKNIFMVLGGILAAVILFFLVRFIISLNRIVRVDQTFSYSNFSLSFNSSVLSTLDYGGNKISDGKIFLANKVSVTNLTTGLLTLATDDFCLEINGECIYPKLDRSGKFIDLAKPYYAEKIGGKASAEYVLVYELDESQAKSRYKIKILDSLTYKKDEVIPKYKEITLTPSFSDSVNVVGEYGLGQEVKLNNTPLLNTIINVKSIELGSKYRYSYEYCYKEECTTSLNGIPAGNGKYFIVLDADFNLDENASYTKYRLGTNNFFDDFTKVEYSIGDNTYISDVTDKTPKNSQDKIVLEVNSSVKDANKIKLLITIRDKRYVITLKEKSDE